jgi:hypothetical protein
MGDDSLSRALEAARDAARRATAAATEPADWDKAVAAWEHALDASAGRSLPPELEAVLLDQAAGVRLQRSWCGGPTAGSDAGAAADLYRRAGDAVPPESPDRRAYLNNLAVALRRVWECERRPAVLDAAVAAHEQAVAASAPDTADGVTSRLQLGKTLRERYDVRRREEDARAAVDALAAAADGAAAADTTLRAECLEALGNARYDLYGATGEANFVDEAVESLRRAFDLLASDDYDRSEYGSNLGSALLARFGVRGDPADLQEAIRLLEQAVVDEEQRGTTSAELLANLGNALGVRSAVTAARGDSDRAVTYLRQAVELAAGSLRRPAMLSNLAAALLERFDITGELVDLDEAIDLLETALAESAPNDPELPSRLSNLGNALRRRQLRRRGGREDLDRAVSAYERALAATADGDPDRTAYHSNLGNALHQRYDVTGDPGDLDRAVQELETAVEQTPAESPDRPHYVNNLSATLSARGERVDSTDDFRRASALLRDALQLQSVVSINRAGMFVNLGNAASELASRTRSAEERDLALAAYRSATRDGIATNPADALAGAHNWTEWAARRGVWAEVVEAHSLGEQAAQRLFRAQVLRADKESWLRDAAGLATEGAFARAALGDAVGAVLALEAGRGLIYSERLKREHVDLDRLRAGHDELALRYGIAAQRVTRLEAGCSLAAASPGGKGGVGHA